MCPEKPITGRKCWRSVPGKPPEIQALHFANSSLEQYRCIDIADWWQQIRQSQRDTVLCLLLLLYRTGLEGRWKHSICNSDLCIWGKCSDILPSDGYQQSRPNICVTVNWDAIYRNLMYFDLRKNTPKINFLKRCQFQSKFHPRIWRSFQGSKRNLIRIFRHKSCRIGRGVYSSYTETFAQNLHLKVQRCGTE